nr:DoxX family protein [Salicibibacter halophilus]
MAVSGFEKLLDIGQYLSAFDPSPIPAPLVHITVIIEMLAGLMLLFGFFVRFSAATLVAPLIAAIFMLPYHQGWIINGYTDIIVLMVIAVILMSTKQPSLSSSTPSERGGLQG